METVVAATQASEYRRLEAQAVALEYLLLNVCMQNFPQTREDSLVGRVELMHGL